MSVAACPLPEQALLARYTAGKGYADCYVAEIPRAVSLARYVEAFYTGGVFRVERLVLAWFASRPSTDLEATQVAAGERNDFAAWRVEDRSADQLLMCDYTGRTRSWFMVEATQGGSRLYFGSAVVPSAGGTGMGFLFAALLGFHKMYSRVLLGSACTRLSR